MKANVVLILPLAWWPSLMLADKWPAPSVQDYYSADSSYFVRVFPFTTPVKYHKWQEASPKKKRRFSAKDTVQTPCHAMLYERTKVAPSLIWKQNLVNQIAPVDAIVSNDGRYVVTFDNHHSMGYGKDVMVVYDYQGNLLKQYSLEQISPFPINRYVASRSSLWWHRTTPAFVTSDKLSLSYTTKDTITKSRVYSLVKLDFE